MISIPAEVVDALLEHDPHCRNTDRFFCGTCSPMAEALSALREARAKTRVKTQLPQPENTHK